MALEKISLESIARLEGGAHAEQFNTCLQRVYEDLRRRPGVGKARTVTLTVTLTPHHVDEGGRLTDIGYQFAIDEKTPARKSPAFIAHAGRQGMFVNELSPGDPGQSTIDQVDPLTGVIADGPDDEGPTTGETETQPKTEKVS